MKVITFQSKEALKYLEKNGYLRCEDKYIDKDKMSQIYNWVIQNMNERVKNKSNATYPIWCWVKCNRSICPLKHKGKPVEGFDVKITFNVKDEEVFITDFRRYSFLLSNTYIPETKTEKEEFEKELKSKNITQEELKAYIRRDKYKTHRTDNQFLEICKKIETTFQRCITTESNVLQGCVWEIRKEQIEKIEILPKNGYIYGSLNYKRKDGSRRDWIKEYYKKVRGMMNKILDEF